MEKNIVYTYKRENHFNEWVAQFQAKESTNVPKDVIEKIRTEFKKQKIKDVSEITHAKVRGLLKKLNMNKYGAPSGVPGVGSLIDRQQIGGAPAIQDHLSQPVSRTN